MKPKSSKFVFKNPNWVLEGEGFFVSFIHQREAMDLQNREPILSLAAAIVSSGKAIDVDCETALCKDHKYFILNGDWTDKYEELIPKGFAACMRLFEKHPEVKSSWSN